MIRSPLQRTSLSTRFALTLYRTMRHQMHRPFATFAFAMSTLAASVLYPASLHAQVIGVQGVLVPARDARPASSGISADLGLVAHAGLADIWTAIAVEYQRQRDLGAGRGRLSADIRLLPPESEGWLVPFVGMSVSANRSGGAQSEWEGTRLGLEALGGAILIPDNRAPIGISIEERFGYVRGREHALATHIGLRFSLY